MKKQIRIVTLAFVAMVMFAGMSVMAQPGRHGPGPRHHHDRISSGRLNSMIAIGTTLGVLDIASRMIAPPVVVNTTPVYTQPSYSTTTYYNTTPYYSTTQVVTTAPARTVYYETTPVYTSPSYNFYNYTPPAPPRPAPAPAPRGDGFRGMPGPDGGYRPVAPAPAPPHHGGGPRSNWR